MSIILPILFLILFIIMGLVALGLTLLSRLVGGLRNLRSLFRVFTGGKTQDAWHGSAKTSSSNKSSHADSDAYSSDKKNAQTNDKMFGHNEGTYVEFEEVRE